MRLAEAIFAIIGAWCTTAGIFVAVWIILRRGIDRRGGLLDLTPPADTRKNARALPLGPPATVVCSECGRPWGESHLGSCSRSQMRGGPFINGVTDFAPTGSYREAS